MRVRLCRLTGATPEYHATSGRGLDGLAEHFRAVQINLCAVVPEHAQQKVGENRRIGHRPSVAEVGGDLAIAGNDRGFVALSEAKLPGIE